MNAFEPPAQSITLAICTCDRPEVATALASALASSHPAFEVLLIDQSTVPVIDQLPGAIAADPRFRYLRLDSRGVGRARNAGLAASRTDLVAFTDDDCTLPDSWLATVERAFLDHPGVGLVFTNVIAGPHDVSTGFIPGYQREGDELVASLWAKRRARGIGAAMAVRRSCVDPLGGFDDLLGPGARFPACEEGDLCVRVLLAGGQVLETSSTAAVHHGFRTWGEGRALAQRNWLGVGAAYSKPLKRGHVGILGVLAYEMYVMGRGAAGRLVRGRSPQGARDILYLLRGVLRGLREPVDRQSLRFSRER